MSVGLSRRGASALDEGAGAGVGAGGWKGASGGGGGGAGGPGPPPQEPTQVTAYAASPAPSGASTPGPPPHQHQPHQLQPQHQHQHQYAGGAPFGRPASAGGPYGPAQPPPPPHYGGGYGGAPPQFGVPFGPLSGAHLLPGPHLGPHAGPPQPDRMDRMDRMDQGSVPVPRRHTPYFGQPDYRVYELNKRLQQRTEESDNLWWDAFATEFFEDDATLTLTFCLEDGPKRYTIGRTLIPRYFRSIFEGGVTELYYNMKHPKESFHNTSITLDCDQCTMVTHHGKPMFTKVCTEGRLILEFTFDDLMRIKSWHLAVRTHRELIPRSVVGHGPDHAVLEQLSKNITRQGITNSTLNYLRLCVILEPMQELMSRHKAYALSPRDCLKTTLFQKWQRMVAPPESQRPANKRRKRKGSTSGANSTPPVPSKKRSPGPNFSLASQDVMVVGEPSLMGGEFGDEDERLITRLENTQYDGGDVAGGFHAEQGAWHPPGDRPGGGAPPPHADQPPAKSPH